ncbi:MAG: hypothetical protein EOO43_08600 [Flavobacterium sp.]|nr:MAG: hypothetical protein EOO43_08600 [Flavobacterium sp.]
MTTPNGILKTVWDAIIGNCAVSIIEFDQEKLEFWIKVTHLRFRSSDYKVILKNSVDYPSIYFTFTVIYKGRLYTQVIEKDYVKKNLVRNENLKNPLIYATGIFAVQRNNEFNY